MRVCESTLEPIVTEYFESDVQGSWYECQSLLRIISDVRLGTSPSSDGVGNAYYIQITPSAGLIETALEEPPRRAVVTLDDFDGAVREWARVVEQSGS
jgi:hypothetical protein